MSATIPSLDTPEDRQTTVDASGRGQLLLEALEDPGCRSILSAADEEAMSAVELSEACDLPLSTTYRKLELLTEAGLLSEGIRIRRSGKHTSEYVRSVDDVHVSVGGAGGVELTLSRREPSTARS